jgi:RNA 2',3'-cyclic 3'-phosphodiesterase
MDVVRTFIAVELPPEIRQELDRAERVLQTTASSAARSIKWVDSESIHLTLKFLGDTSTGNLDAIRGALAEAGATSTPFALKLGQAGCFPNARQPRVLWIGVSGDLDALLGLQEAVERTVSPLGFPGEGRRFSPHLTLGRLRDDAAPDVRQHLAAAIQSLHPAALEFHVNAVRLMRSDLRPDGAIYTELAAVPLSTPPV